MGSGGTVSDEQEGESGKSSMALGRGCRRILRVAGVLLCVLAESGRWRVTGRGESFVAVAFARQCSPCGLPQRVRFSLMRFPRSPPNPLLASTFSLLSDLSLPFLACRSLHSLTEDAAIVSPSEQRSPALSPRRAALPNTANLSDAPATPRTPDQASMEAHSPRKVRGACSRGDDGERGIVGCGRDHFR